MIRILYLVFLSNFAFATSSPPIIDSPNYLKTADSLNIGFENLPSNYRLGDETKPSYYKIELLLNQTSVGRFPGVVEVNFKALEENVKTVWLVAEGITIKDTDVQIYKSTTPTENIFESLNVTQLSPYQKYGFILKNVLSVVDDYVIKIQYTGNMYENTVMRGLYKSYYKQENKTKTLYSTHFGQQARRLMPCWDENRFKAQFQLTIHRDSALHSMSISNAKLKKTQNGVDEYEATSVISPYLLAVVVAEFEKNQRDERFGVYARPQAKNQTEFALELGPKIIQALDAWTNMPYYSVPGVDKMDIAAIPDFSAGAMENWGLLIHREVSLLYDKMYATSLQKNRIALIIAHEIAHMWFGDIVTCHEFGETWLNEGFARYFQFVALEAVDKSYEGFSQFPVTTLQASFQPDAASTAHPLTSPGKYSYSEIRTMFGSITYDKGGSILRMTRALMGDEKFQAAIREYLRKRMFKTALPEDLFTELEREHPGIVDILGLYTQQGGFPLVTATKTGDTIKLTQKRFLSDGVEHNDTTTWNIPITVATDINDFMKPLSKLTIYPSKMAENFSIDVKNASLDFYVLNVQQYGYYRVNYDIDNWLKIGKALKSENYGGIHVINRAQIIDDLFNLAKVGYVKYDLVFDIISYVKNEKEYSPWLATLNGLSYLQQRVSSEDSELKTMFDAFVLEILTSGYNYVTSIEKPTHLDELNYIQILTWTCKYGHEKCISESIRLFDSLMNGGIINTNDKPATYCTAMRETNTSWDKMWEMYVNTNYATEQANILTALGCSKRTIDINKLMDKILTDDIRPQDKSSAYTSAYTGNQENVDIVYSYIVENDRKWMDKMSIVSTLGDLSARFVREEQFNELDEYAKKKLNNEDREALQVISQKNRKLLEWDKQRLAELKGFFKGSGSMNGINIFLSVILTVLVLVLQV